MPIQDYDLLRGFMQLVASSPLAAVVFWGVKQLVPPAVKLAASVEQGKDEFKAMRVAVEAVGHTVTEMKGTLTDVHQRVMDLQLHERRDANNTLTFKSTRNPR